MAEQSIVTVRLETPEEAPAERIGKTSRRERETPASRKTRSKEVEAS